MNRADILKLKAGGKLEASGRAGVPPEIFDVKAMLIEAERIAYYNLTRHAYEGIGEIVDLGCLVGGSTICFGRALLDRDFERTCRIHSYDLFLPSGYIRDYLAPDPLSVSTIDVFWTNVAAIKEYLAVYEGDVCKLGWCGRPIEVLFVDCAKSWLTTDAIKSQFFRSLIPGRSLLIQQDFLFDLTPWLFMQMELLSPFFELVHYHQCNSAYFFLKKPIPESYLQIDIRELWASDKADLLRAAASRYAGTAIEPWLDRSRRFFETTPDPTLTPEAP